MPVLPVTFQRKSRASAAVDLTGRWGVRVTGFGDVIGCVVDIMQSGGSLHVVGQCSTTGAVELAGTVDAATGRVAVVGHGGPCSTITVDGTAAADGQSIGGTVSCMVGTASLGGLFTASHCGNGILDSGEECDDGNVFDGDCCSSVCRFEASGSACPDDNSPCTTDVCDGRGQEQAGQQQGTCRGEAKEKRWTFKWKAREETSNHGLEV